MKIGDSVRAKNPQESPGEFGVVVDIDDDGFFHPVLHVAFGGSTLAYGFTRDFLEYADA